MDLTTTPASVRRGLNQKFSTLCLSFGGIARRPSMGVIDPTTPVSFEPLLSQHPSR